MKRPVCAKCNRKQGDVKFSWTVSGQRRLICDVCFESNTPTKTWQPAANYTIIQLAPEAAEGSQSFDIQIAKPDGWRGRKF